MSECNGGHVIFKKELVTVTFVHAAKRKNTINSQHALHGACVMCTQTKDIHLCIEDKQKYDSDTMNTAVITINCLSKTLTFPSDYH